MTSPSSRTRVAPLLAALLLATLRVLAVAPALASNEANRSCGWTVQFSPDKVNLFYPDSGATYWLSVVPVPPGGSIELKGQYPHARYTSLVTYSAQTQAIDGLNDVSIKADPGSTNPFIAGASRTSTKRNYTVQVRAERAPKSHRPANTLYLENAEGTKTTKPLGLAILALRVYVSDRGTDLAGGVPLPSIALRTSSGATTVLPNCPDLLPSTPLTSTVASLGLDVPVPPIGLFGTNPPAWRKFTNLLSAIVSNATDTGLLGRLYPILKPVTDRALPPGGFFENPDNKYVSTTMDAGYGDVLEFTARAPTTPRTVKGPHRMGAGQLRYWSVCSENPQTTLMLACAYDEQFPLDGRQRYTLVVSSPAHRPKNATAACGVVWLPTGPFPQTLLLLRHMLPASDFEQAVQNVEVGKEASQMGDYYPNGKYYPTKAAYEAKGCRS